MPRLLRRFLLILLLAASPALAPGAPAQTPEAPAPGARQAILGTIQAQLEAFQRDNGSRAFSYATPRLRRLFRTPENFMEMVRSGYRPVYRPQAVEFLDTRVVRGRTIQAVRFVGPDGAAVVALYTMERQPDGSWRIAAVRLVRSGELTS